MVSRVSTPFPDIIEKNARAFQLAKSLVFCPDDPVPSSCPPDVSSCGRRTVNTISVKVGSSGQYQNLTDAFVIGMIPHSWTLVT